jgi:hypothetical protein
MAGSFERARLQPCRNCIKLTAALAAGGMLSFKMMRHSLTSSAERLRETCILKQANAASSKAVILSEAKDLSFIEILNRWKF